MIKIFMPLITIFFGAFLGYSNDPKDGIIPTKKQVQCSSQTDETLTKGITEKKKSFCITKIPNLGEHFDLSEKQAETRIFKYFDESLKDYIRPNEHNVYTQESGPGTSAQKYDPREYKYTGFNIDKEINSDEKENCGETSFVRVKDLSKDAIVKFITETRFRSRNYDNSKRSYLSNYFTHSFSTDFPSTFPWFRNLCSKKLSLLLNHCIADSSLDHQYEEILFDKVKKKVAVNVYCKRSNQKKWKLIKNISL
jgi:hypothetical protein